MGIRFVKNEKRSKRCLVIPHQLAYGHRKISLMLIPAYSNLIFEIELIDIYKSKKANKL